MGYVVSANVMEPNDVKVLKDKQWPTPTKPEEFRKFQRFVAYYRKLLRYFLKNSTTPTNLIYVPSATRSTTTMKKKKTIS